MKTTIVSNVSKTVAGCLLACGVMVSPALAKGGHGGGGHGGGHHGGGHHGGGGHHAPHHGGAHHSPSHRGGQHGEHHEQHHAEHHSEHHDTHHADHRDDRRDHHDDRHVHYHYDHHHYYSGGWGWLPAVWGWPGYVGPDYGGSSVNYTTVNNNSDTTNTSTTDDSQSDSSNVADDGQDLPPLNNRGIIRVKLPTPRAVVTFDGHKILGSRTKRLIVTSPIEGDGPVKYQVHATWWQEGVQQHEVREGFVSAGGNVLADFTQPQPEDATFTQAPAE